MSNEQHDHDDIQAADAEGHKFRGVDQGSRDDRRTEGDR